MGARDPHVPDSGVRDDAITAGVYTNPHGDDTRVAAYMPGNLAPPTPSRVRGARTAVAPQRDEYQQLGYDGADELRIGAAFDIASKNRGVIGPGDGVGPNGWPLTGGSLNATAGGMVLPHLDISASGVERGPVVPFKLTTDELVEIPPVYVGSPT